MSGGRDQAGIPGLFPLLLQGCFWDKTLCTGAVLEVNKEPEDPAQLSAQLQAEGGLTCAAYDGKARDPYV